MSGREIAVRSLEVAAVPTPSSIQGFQELFERSLRLAKVKHPENPFLASGSSLQDLQQAVLAAKAKYDGRSKDNKAKRWLSRFSKRVMLYSNILDTFVQHHPEYTALAWGTFKLLFVLVLNEEELVSELSKAMCKIAEVLPRVELKAVTYETEDMKRLIGNLISSIIDFFSRVIEWYEENRVKHAFNSLWRPFKLRFEDLCDEIDEGARRIDKLAEALMQAEIKELLSLTRALSHEQTTMRMILLELKQMVTSQNAINAPLIFNTHQNTCHIQLAQILTFVANSNFADPIASLRYSSQLRKRRGRLRPGSDLVICNTPSERTQVVQWLTRPESSVLHLKSALKAKDNTKDFTTGIVELLISFKYPVLWVLRSRAAPELGEDRYVHLLKNLAWQALQLDKSAANAISADFNASLFQNARSEEEWFAILQTIVKRFSRIHMVIDLEILNLRSDAVAFSSVFYKRLLEFLDACKPTVVKVLLASYRKQSGALIENTSEQEGIPTSCINASRFLEFRQKKTPPTIDMFSQLRKRLEQHEAAGARLSSLA